MVVVPGWRRWRQWLSGAQERAPGLTAEGHLKSGRLAGLSMSRAIWVLSWPILVEAFLNSLVGLTDTVLAAGLENGKAATDAIGAAAYMTWFIGLFIMALGVGSTALISRSVGGGRLAVANAAVGQTVLAVVVLGAGVGVLVAGTVPVTMRLFALSGESGALYSVYLLILSASVPLMGILFGGIACARGAGDSFRPLLAMAVVNAVNIVVSWMLSGVTLQLPPWLGGGQVTSPFGLDYGVTGIALGTLIANAVGAAILIWILATGVSGVRLIRRRLTPHWHTIRRLARLAWPGFLETMGLWVGNFLVMLIVARLAIEGAMGSHIVAIRIEAFSFMPGFAMGMASATLVGQYLGAGSTRMAQRSAVVCTAIAVLVMGALGGLFMIASTPIVSLFTAVPEHLESVPTLISIAGAFQAPFAISIVLRAALRGAGDVRAAMWLTWITTYAVRLPLVYALSGVRLTVPEWLGGGVIENPFRDEPSLALLWVALMLELCVRALAYLVRFLQGRWKTTTV